MPVVSFAGRFAGTFASIGIHARIEESVLNCIVAGHDESPFLPRRASGYAMRTRFRASDAFSRANIPPFLGIDDLRPAPGAILLANDEIYLGIENVRLEIENAGFENAARYSRIQIASFTRETF